MVISRSPGRLPPPPFDLFEVKMKYVTMHPSDEAQDPNGRLQFHPIYWHTVISLPFPNEKIYRFYISGAHETMGWHQNVEDCWDPVDEPEDTRFEYESSALFTPSSSRAVTLHDWYMLIDGDTEIIHERVCGTPRPFHHYLGGKAEIDGEPIVFYQQDRIPFYRQEPHPITSLAVFEKRTPSIAIKRWKKKFKTDHLCHEDVMKWLKEKPIKFVMTF